MVGAADPASWEEVGTPVSWYLPKSRVPRYLGTQYIAGQSRVASLAPLLQGCRTASLKKKFKTLEISTAFHDPSTTPPHLPVSALKMSRNIQDQINDDTSSEDDEYFSESDGEDAKVKKLADQYDVDEKDSDEEELERLVLGNKAGFRANLFRNTTDSDDEEEFTGLRIDDGEEAPGATGLEDLDDAALFMLDTGTGTGGKQIAPVVATVVDKTEPQPAWADSDDEKLTVSLARAGPTRALRETEADDLVDGAEYARRLRKQFLRVNGLPAWVKDATKDRKTKHKRRSSAASSASASAKDSDASGSDDDDVSALPLEKFLRDANAGDGGRRKKRKLRPEVIECQRSRDIPDNHKARVESLCFHPQHPVLLSSSAASILYLHHISPSAEPTPNPQLTSVQVKSVPVRCSAFLHPDGDEIIFAGRRRFFHSWNISTGLVRRVNNILGHQREQRSMERFRLSPDGQHMALIATDRKGGGMLNIVSVGSMQWVAQARLDSRGGIADFCWWRNGVGMTILGRDGQVGEWSLATKRTVGLWRDEGSIGGTVMAMGGRGGPEALGGDRWVAMGSNSGVMNVYNRNDLIAKTGEDGRVEIKSLPEPARRFEHLTTPITTTTFSPDGQLLAFGSLHKKDALKLVHLPSCTVYRNWPTTQTPLGRITAVALGYGMDGDLVLAVGNDAGKVRLWEIRP